MTRHPYHRLAASMCVALAIFMIVIAATAASPMLLGDQGGVGNGPVPFAHDRDQIEPRTNVRAPDDNDAVLLPQSERAQNGVARRGRRDLTTTPVG